jgi:Cof subfamily protein (haloacid dehalogenase superfamily)
MTASQDRYRIAFIDLDGTLLNSDLKISAFTAAALKRVSQSGVTLVLASGRPLESIARLANELDDPNIFAIASNGGCVVSLATRKILKVHCMAREIVERLLSVGAEAGIAVCLYQADCWYASWYDTFVDLERRRSGSEPAGLIDASVAAGGIIKAMFVGDPEDLGRLKARLDANDGRGTEAFFTYPEYLEVMPAGISKVVACEMLLESLGLSWADAIVLGDGPNDLTMMVRARGRVAMGNAHPDIKAASNVTAPSNDEDGAAHALLALCMDEPASRARLSG